MWNRVRTVTKQSNKKWWNCPWLNRVRHANRFQAPKQFNKKGWNRLDVRLQPPPVKFCTNATAGGGRDDETFTLVTCQIHGKNLWEEYIAGRRRDWGNVSLVITLLDQCNGWQQTKTIATHGWMSGKPFKWLGSEQLPLACAKKDQSGNLV